MTRDDGYVPTQLDEDGVRTAECPSCDGGVLLDPPRFCPDCRGSGRGPAMMGPRFRPRKLGGRGYIAAAAGYHRRRPAPPTMHETVSCAGGVAGPCCGAQDRPGRDRRARP